MRPIRSVYRGKNFLLRATKKLAMRSLPIALIFSVLSWFTTPALAEEWLLFWQEGERPNRSLYFMATDLRSVLSIEEEIATVTESRTQEEMSRAAEQAKTVRAQVMQVYESAEGPYASLYWADFRARDRMGRLEKGIHFYRDDRDHAEFSHPQWLPVPSNWQSRAFAMAINDQPWREALESLRRAGTLGDPARQESLVAQGALYVGRHSLPTQLADLAWASFWQDGQRPPWQFSERSPEERERRRERTLEYLTWAQGQIGQMQEQATQVARQVEAERLEEERRAEARRRRPPSRLNAELESWIGSPVEELLARVGPPTATRREGRLEYMTYSGSRTAPRTQQVLSPNGRHMETIVVAQDVLWSDITYVILEGRVYDFVVEGNDPDL